MLMSHDGMKLPAHKGGASGRCRYVYRVGFPPRLPTYRRWPRWGHPADLPAKLPVLTMALI
jgi:hypothetical protein